MALISKLNAIGDAIREKTGKTDLLTLDEMPVEIAAIETGGGSAELPEEAFLITGACDYKFSGTGWNWFIENYGDKITTEDITSASFMFFQNEELEEIPFDLNFDNSTHKEIKNMFQNCSKLKVIGKIKNAYPSNLIYFFTGCQNLRELPELENWNFSRIQTYAYANIGGIFSSCYSLRRIPEELLKELYGIMTSQSYTVFYNGFQNCRALDEIRGLNPQTGALTGNAFGSTFDYCSRVKDIIFATQEDGTPYAVNWKNQTIDLSKQDSSYGGVGFSAASMNPTTGAISSQILNYNSGITADKRLTADTYEALKDDPDAWASSPQYSRYNHDSAVNTINSLPSTSNTGCTIKFKGIAGSATDGGAINTLTEEEIAVATAKGWTVTLV